MQRSDYALEFTLLNCAGKRKKCAARTCKVRLFCCVWAT